jgi:Uma2 family endonuclease
VTARDSGTTILDLANEFQPDASLAIDPECGGQTKLRKVKKKWYVAGAPELCVEVAYSSAAIDLHAKKKVYARAGVREYVVVVIQQDRVACFERKNKTFHDAPPDESGVWKSKTFPGLWLDCRAVLRNDSAEVLRTLHEGLATPEHRKFCEKLKSLCK